MITLILGSVLMVPLALAVIFGPLAIAVRSQKADANKAIGATIGVGVGPDRRKGEASFRAAVAGG